MPQREQPACQSHTTELLRDFRDHTSGAINF
jgi:hypothetical protein